MTTFDEYCSEMCRLRRAIHRRPEEGWTEFETTWRVFSFLESLGGFTLKVGQEVVNPEFVLGRDEVKVMKAEERALEHGVSEAFLARLGGFTGVVAEMDTGRPGPAVAFRFDMDCVQVGESQDPEHVPVALGFASEREGLMHACGHDGHTATGLALAHWVADYRASLCGRIRLIFQPAEEGTRGATAMAEAGVVDNVNWFFGAHVGCDCAPGEVGIIQKGFLATTKIDIAFTGKASHAGSDPEKGRSALMAAAACSLMMQGISRHREGSTRVAFGTLHAGEGRNVTPVHAVIQAEVRGATGSINDWMTERVRSIVRGVSEAYEVQGKMVKAGEACDMISDKEACDLVADAARAIDGVTVKLLNTEDGSEDCSVLMRRAQKTGAKAAFFLYGCKHNGHHRSDFDIQDETTLPVAFSLMTGIVTRLNGKA